VNTIRKKGKKKIVIEYLYKEMNDYTRVVFLSQIKNKAWSIKEEEKREKKKMFYDCETFPSSIRLNLFDNELLN
jgi:hypothetical protein